MPVITRGDRDYLSDPSILKESYKKNFIRENIKHLKQLEKKNRRDKRKIEVIDVLPGAFTRRSLGKPTKSQSRLSQTKSRRRLIESKSSRSLVISAPRSPTTQIELAKTASTKTGRSVRPKKLVKVQGIQASGEDKSSNSDSDVIITKKEPSRQREKKDRGLQTLPSQTVERSFSPFNIDDIKREMKAVQYKPKKNVKSEKTDPNKAPPSYQKGVLPKYLREQKKDSGDVIEEQTVTIKEREREREREREIHQNTVTHQVPVKKSTVKESPTCPPGHIQISDFERKQQLNEMRKHYADLINKLNRVPVHADTIKARQMKTELESELENLEAAISMFSKEKLFVKIS